MKYQIVSRSISMILVMGVLCSCASTPNFTLEDEITLAVEPTTLANADVEVITKGAATTRSIALGTVGGVGGGAIGAMAGFGGGILACGPVFIICSPAAAIGMGAAGAAGGALMGAELGGEGITGDQAAQFNQLSVRLLPEEVIQSTANTSFNESVSKYWSIDVNSDNHLQLEIKSFGFNILEDDVMQITVRALLTINTEEINESLTVTYEGDLQSINYWLQDNGENILSEMEQAMAEVSESMVTMLRLGSR